MLPQIVLSNGADVRSDTNHSGMDQVYRDINMDVVTCHQMGLDSR